METCQRNDSSGSKIRLKCGECTHSLPQAAVLAMVKKDQIVVTSLYILWNLDLSGSEAHLLFCTISTGPVPTNFGQTIEICISRHLYWLVFWFSPKVRSNCRCDFKPTVARGQKAFLPSNFWTILMIEVAIVCNDFVLYGLGNSTAMVIRCPV